MRTTGFRTGFYGNVHKQYYDFPVAYCRALARDRRLGTDVVLDMNEDGPLIGAPPRHDRPAQRPGVHAGGPALRAEVDDHDLAVRRIADLGELDRRRPGTSRHPGPVGTGRLCHGLVSGAARTARADSLGRYTDGSAEAPCQRPGPGGGAERRVCDIALLPVELADLVMRTGDNNFLDSPRGLFHMRVLLFDRVLPVKLLMQVTRARAGIDCNR